MEKEVKTDADNLQRTSTVDLSYGQSVDRSKIMYTHQQYCIMKVEIADQCSHERDDKCNEYQFSTESCVQHEMTSN